MKSRPGLLVFALLLISSPLFSQIFLVGVKSEWATFEMRELRDLTKAQIGLARDTLGVEPYQVSAFPNQWSWRTHVEFSKNKINYALIVGPSVTGSRLSYGDYSGRLLEDTYIRSINISGRVTFPVHLGQTSVYLGAGVQSYFSNVKTTTEIEFYQENIAIRRSSSYTTKGLMFFPTLDVYKRLSRNARFMISYSYTADLNGGRYVDSELGPSRTDWSGHRLSFGLGWVIRVKNEE